MQISRFDSGPERLKGRTMRLARFLEWACPTLQADARRFLERIEDEAEYRPSENGDRESVTLPHGAYEQLDELLYAAASMNGWGVWIVNQSRWCNAGVGDGNGLVVFRTKEEADANALHQSVLYDLGPCEARPFDLAKEKTNETGHHHA